MPEAQAKTVHKTTSADYKKEKAGEMPYEWDVQLESLATLFVLRLAVVRPGINPRKALRDINYTYIAKGRKGGRGKGKITSYTPTRFQRMMLANGGC